MICYPLAVSADPPREVLDALADAVAGRGPVLLPHAPDDEDPPSAEVDLAHSPAAVADGGGIAVGTSGSTGRSKRALLTPVALAASADATHRYLGGPGQWLLALPGHHIAGLQVLLRSLRAGETPAVLPPGSFTPETFRAGVDALTGTRRYASLVPTQLARIVGDEAALTAARSLDAVLVGGSNCPATVLFAAREAGIRVVVTYGMSETAGGCVYDGTPLDGVHLRLVDRRIHLAGAVLAAGYLVPQGAAPPADSPFVEHGGLRWLRTDDTGHLDEGRLVVDGRVDDVIISGGLKVWPAQVEHVLAPFVPSGCDIVVVGLPDPEWGQRVALVVECPERRGDVLTTLLDNARTVLPPHARPRIARMMHRFPRKGPGKTDRRRLASMLMEPGWDDEDGSAPEEG